MASTPILEMRDVVKEFPGVRALDGVSLDVLPGEVHALVGENGAGKSTLMHVLAGVLTPEAGSVHLDGHTVRFRDPHDAARQGIGVVFQELSLAPDLSIAENVFAHRQPAGPLGLIRWGELYARTAEALRLFEWDADPRALVGSLPAARQQVVEILKAVAQRPRLLILDEPTSSLSAAETRLLFANIRRLQSEGVSLVYISHHLAEVFELADRITVLRDGRRVGTVAVREATEESLVRMMVGRDVRDLFGRSAGLAAGTAGAERFRLDGGRRAGVFEDVSFSVRAGEIVGLAGLAGAGRTEVARAIFGADPLDAGRITMDGGALAVRSPSDAIASGIAYLTESRKEDGLFLDLPLRANLAAPRLSAFAGRGGLMNEAAITAYADTCRREFGIAAAGAWHEVGNLSGGNQQKALLAMWTGARPRLLIADEPTRGVDVGARADIYALIRRLVAEGMAVLLVSSDLPEVLGLSDRVLVMRSGRLVGEFARGEATEERVVACAAGVGAGGNGEAA